MEKYETRFGDANKNRCGLLGEGNMADAENMCLPHREHCTPTESNALYIRGWDEQKKK